MASSKQSNNCKEVHIFFGVSGSGKSSTINSLCRKEQCKVGKGETSETQNCKLVCVNHPDSVFNENYVLDMQGYNDTRPEHNQSTIFKMMKLYFVESDITKVKSIIFVINISDTRTNFYRGFAKFLGELFQKEQVEKNSIVLLTQGDQLSLEAKENKMKNIQENLSELVRNYGWPTMQMIEWSNVKPLPGQEQKLFNAIQNLQGFNPKAALQQIENEINMQVQKLYDSPDNIQIVKHKPEQKLKEIKVNRQVEDHIVINCDRTEEIIVPKQMELKIFSVEKIIHFSGTFTSNEGFVNTVLSVGLPFGAGLGTKYLAAKLAGNDKKTQTKTMQFDHKVTNVTFDKTPNDIRLLDRLDYKIDPKDPRQVTIDAYFSYGIGITSSWDFDVKVTATVEQSVVTQEEYTNKIVVPQQRIEKVMKNVTDTKQDLVTLREAYEQKIYKRTKEEIKKSLIQQRLNELS